MGFSTTTCHACHPVQPICAQRWPKTPFILFIYLSPRSRCSGFKKRDAFSPIIHEYPMLWHAPAAKSIVWSPSDGLMGSNLNPVSNVQCNLIHVIGPVKSVCTKYYVPIYPIIMIINDVHVFIHSLAQLFYQSAGLSKYESLSPSVRKIGVHWMIFDHSSRDRNLLRPVNQGNSQESPFLTSQIVLRQLPRCANGQSKRRPISKVDTNYN